MIGLPVTPEFWDALFLNAREWGCLQYQQDWMYTQGALLISRVLSTLTPPSHIRQSPVPSSSLSSSPALIRSSPLFSSSHCRHKCSRPPQSRDQH